MLTVKSMILTTLREILLAKDDIWKFDNQKYCLFLYTVPHIAEYLSPLFISDCWNFHLNLN